jgi:hypothetical protein
MSNALATATVTIDGVTETVAICYEEIERQALRDVEELRASLRADWDDDAAAEERFIIVLW